MPLLLLILATVVILITRHLLLVARRRMKWFNKLEKLPLPSTAEEAFPIYYQFGFVEFPFLVTKALEFGLFKTYGIPSISKLLVATGESTERSFRRYDDTDLLIREFIEHAPNSARANTALRRLNALHGKYPISNADYIYVLCVFIVEPCNWIDMYGYRKCHAHEKRSAYLVWKDIGQKMGIKNIPVSYEAAVQYMSDYEAKHMVFDSNNAELASASVKLLLSNIPRFLHRPAYHVVYALCSPRLRAAMGFANPHPIASYITPLLLRALALVIRYFCLPRQTPYVRTPASLQPTSDGGFRGCPVFSPYQPIYKDGYRVDELGPEKYRSKRELADLN